MISAKKLEEITGILINGLFRDGEIMYCEMPLVEYDGKRYDLRDIVAMLHNYLYEAVKGERYNYMFHWANKVLADCDDDVFEEEEAWEIRCARQQYTMSRNTLRGTSWQDGAKILTLCGIGDHGRMRQMQKSAQGMLRE